MNAANCAELIRLQRLHAKGNPCHARGAQRARKLGRKRLGIRLAGELDRITVAEYTPDEFNQADPQQRGRSAADVHRLDLRQIPRPAMGVDLRGKSVAVGGHGLIQRAPLAHRARVEIAVRAFGFAEGYMQVQSLEAHGYTRSGVGSPESDLKATTSASTSSSIDMNSS